MYFKPAPKQAYLLREPVTIEGLSHEGRGIARYKGKTLFVEGALPQEVVSVKVTEDKRRLLSGHVTEVITPSPERVAPLCRYFKRVVDVVCSIGLMKDSYKAKHIWC